GRVREDHLEGFPWWRVVAQHRANVERCGSVSGLDRVHTDTVSNAKRKGSRGEPRTQPRCQGLDGGPIIGAGEIDDQHRAKRKDCHLRRIEIGEFLVSSIRRRQSEKGGRPPGMLWLHSRVLRRGKRCATTVRGRANG